MRQTVWCVIKIAIWPIAIAWLIYICRVFLLIWYKSSINNYYSILWQFVVSIITLLFLFLLYTYPRCCGKSGSPILLPVAFGRIPSTSPILFIAVADIDTMHHNNIIIDRLTNRFYKNHACMVTYYT